MTRKDKFLAVAFIAAIAVVCAQTARAADSVSLSSPNGQVQFRLLLNGPVLRYTVALKSKPAIEESALGITVDGVNLAEGAQAGKTERYRTNETYPWYGVHSTAVDRSNGMKVALRHAKSGAAYTLEFRAYDDAVAFRFIVPGKDKESRIPDEATAFRLPVGSTVWYHDLEGHYEGVHKRAAVEDVKSGQWVAPPFTYKLPGGAGYASITEAALLHYAGMALQADGSNVFAARLGHSHPPSYPFRLRYKEDIERVAKPASIEGTITAPWRVVMIGSDLNALVNCDVVHNLAPPPDKQHFPQGLKTEWLKPGRAVWKYLDGGGQNTFENMKEFSKQASELGFEYNVLEGFWSRWPEAQLKELVDYSRGLGVGIVLWKHSKDLRTPEARRAFFDLCKRNGIAGAKIDFFDHEARDVVEQYDILLRDAAEAHMVINFHGANKPTGESRTWPNEMTREGIRGMEARNVLRAPHDATLPFTRMLAGHADYTPMVFSAQRRNDTTWAHQIATAAIFTSPLLVYGGNPQSILENPAIEVIKAIPSVWDETIVLPFSEIGEVAGFARRRGNTWFVAIVNGPAAKSVKIDLSFLGNGRYNATQVRDDKDEPAAVKIEKAALTRKDSLAVDMRAGGGFVARFSVE